MSLDPLAPQYPHNSPYAFAENRVIDGNELEGLEYLSFHEARVEFESGRLCIKLENFSDTFQDAYKQKYGYETTLTSLPLFYKDNINNADNQTGNSDDAMIDNKYDMVREVRFNKSNGNVDGRQRFYNGGFTSNNTYGKSYQVTPLPAKGWALSVLLVYDIYKGVKDFINTKAMVDDKIALDKQIRSWKVTDRLAGVINQNKATVVQVLTDIDNAIKKGIIKPENQNLKDLTEIANIVMFGGNGSEGVQIRKTAERIINEVSDPVAKIRLLNMKINLNSLKMFDEKENIEKTTCIPCEKEKKSN